MITVDSAADERARELQSTRAQCQAASADRLAGAVWACVHDEPDDRAIYGEYNGYIISVDTDVSGCTLDTAEALWAELIHRV